MNDIHGLLEYVREQRAIDFKAYRPNTMMRRLALRLSATGMPDFPSYLAYIKKQPGELDSLIDTLTIKVSSFFRDPLVFEMLRDIVLPELFDTFKGVDLRIWCAGCARGEEAYSIAILVKEFLGKEKPVPRVFIIGTDIDREALEHARQGVYQADSLSEVRKGFLDRYFVPEDGFYRLRDEVRSLVTFARHDISTAMTPKEGIFSDYHLVLCRNVLIYFNKGLSEKVMSALSGFIPPGGYLALGEAESVPPRLDKVFSEVMRGVKIFKKIS
jgi:chemotaxis methyl-accepting protein methylase